MRPFGLPWLTFGALVVVAASIVLSIVWAVLSSGSGGGSDE
jgi:hypothetical protein